MLRRFARRSAVATILGLLGWVLLPTLESAAQSPAGMRVYTDPDTGQFLEEPRIDLPRPTFPSPGRANELPLDREVLDDGTVAIHLRESFQHQLTAHVGPDGQVHLGCHHTAPGEH